MYVFSFPIFQIFVLLTKQLNSLMLQLHLVFQVSCMIVRISDELNVFQVPWVDRCLLPYGGDIIVVFFSTHGRSGNYLNAPPNGLDNNFCLKKCYQWNARNYPKLRKYKDNCHISLKCVEYLRMPGSRQPLRNQNIREPRLSLHLAC